MLRYPIASLSLGPLNFPVLGLPDAGHRRKHDWIEQIETLDEKLDEYTDAQKRVNGFDIRYNANLDAEEDEWRNCAKVLSRRSIDSVMRNSW